MDFPALYELIESATKSATELDAGMRRVIDECAKQRPHGDWQALSQLDYRGDFEHLKNWLSNLLDESPPSDAVTGLWFGLFNPVDEDDHTIADLYVTGGVHDPADIDWTCAPSWEPEGRYANSRFLADLCRIAYKDDDGLGNDAEYPLALAYACLAVRDLARNFASVLSARERALFVGFDSGDLLCIGAISPDGLRLSADSVSLA